MQTVYLRQTCAWTGTLLETGLELRVDSKEVVDGILEEGPADCLKAEGVMSRPEEQHRM